MMMLRWAVMAPGVLINCWAMALSLARCFQRLEPVIYTFTERLAEDYNGGYWDFHRLSNDGFYMSPSNDRSFHVTCDNQFEGDLSSDALGITACLYAYSHLSFGEGDFERECARHYHLLRDFMMEHGEARATLGATD